MAESNESASKYSFYSAVDRFFIRRLIRTDIKTLAFYAGSSNYC
jgi:hypothetical protein